MENTYVVTDHDSLVGAVCTMSASFTLWRAQLGRGTCLLHGDTPVGSYGTFQRVCRGYPSLADRHSSRQPGTYHSLAIWSGLSQILQVLALFESAYLLAWESWTANLRSRLGSLLGTLNSNNISIVQRAFWQNGNDQNDQAIKNNSRLWHDDRPADTLVY